jgi:hypothetical protein
MVGCGDRGAVGSIPLKTPLPENPISLVPFSGSMLFRKYPFQGAYTLGVSGVKTDKNRLDRATARD